MAEFSEQSEELAPKLEEIELAGELAPQPEAEKVIKLSEPSKELTTRLLSEITFKERLVGVYMHSMAGNIEESIYSFEEAVDLLHFDAGELRIRGSGSIGYIDLDELQKWVGDVFGDKELAEAIGEKIKEGSSYKERVLPIKVLMQQRLNQCKEIAGEGTEA